MNRKMIHTLTTQPEIWIWSDSDLADARELEDLGLVKIGENHGDYCVWLTGLAGVMNLLLTSNAEPIAPDDPGFMGLEGQGYLAAAKGKLIVVDVMPNRAIIQMLDEDTGEWLAEWEVK